MDSLERERERERERDGERGRGARGPAKPDPTDEDLAAFLASVDVGARPLGRFREAEDAGDERFVRRWNEEVGRWAPSPSLALREREREREPSSGSSSSSSAPDTDREEVLVLEERAAVMRRGEALDVEDEVLAHVLLRSDDAERPVKEARARLLALALALLVALLAWLLAQ